MSDSTCILVLGTPRSGTSCVAGIVHLLGVPMAPVVSFPDGVRERFGGANEANPKGFFNDSEFEGWAHWVYGGYLPESPVAPTPEQDDWLSNLVAERRAHSNVWGVKEWRLALCFPRFVELAGNVKVIRLSRDCTRSADSWNAHFTRLHVATATDMQRAKGFIDSAVAASGLPVLDIDFDGMIDRPLATVQSIAQFVGRPVTQTARNMIDESLRRF